MMPTNVAARMTLAADPGRCRAPSRRGSSAAGPVDPRHVGGCARGCSRRRRRRWLRRRARERRRGDRARDPRRRRQGRRVRASGAQAARPARRAHPRARGRARGERRRTSRSRARFRDAVHEVWGKPLTMNVSMPIAAVLLDLGFPAAAAKAVPLLARTAGLLAHLAEEQEQPIGFLMAAAAEEAIDYRRRRGRLMLAPRSRPAVGRAARARRRALPRAARLPLRALGLLPREAGRGGIRLRRGGGRARGDRAAAPDREGRAQGDVHAREPDRRAPLRDAGRDRPDLLDERHHRHAELHPAHGGRSRQLGDGLGAQLRGLRRHRRASASSPPTTRGRSWPARRSRPFDRIGLCHIPLGTGNTERLLLAVELLRPEAAVLTPSYAAYLIEWAAERDVDLAGVERRARARGGRARRRRAGLPREARSGLGRQGHRGDGDRRHRRVALGRVRGAGRHAPGRARLRPRRADRPRDGRGARAGRRRHRRARADAPPASRRAAAALPHARPRPGPD